MVGVSINPLLTTNASGLFDVTSTGFIVGTMLDDPSVRNYIAGGTLGLSENPIWGGVGINEAIVAEPNTLGNLITRATNVTANTAGQLTGFSIFNQASNWINTPQSPVPTGQAGMMVPFLRLGSGARLVLAIDPALTTLNGGSISQQVSWDFGGQRISKFQAAYAANVITAATWAANVATFTTTSAHGIAIGAAFTVSGVTPAAYNGTYIAVTGTTGSTLKGALPLASTPGAGSAFGQVNAGGGALAVNVLDILTTNNKTVVWDSVNQVATWNANGPVAVVSI